MRTAGIGQAVIFMSIITIAASCAATREYSSKLFTPRVPVAKDSQATVLRFLDLDHVEADKSNWVTTDIIMGRDTIYKSLALDKLSQVFPSSTPAASTTRTTGKITIPEVSKTVEEKSEPVASYIKQGEVRTKRTRD
jgi:hypothetical protein